MAANRVGELLNKLRLQIQIDRQTMSEEIDGLYEALAEGFDLITLCPTAHPLNKWKDRIIKDHDLHECTLCGMFRPEDKYSMDDGERGECNYCIDQRIARSE